MLVHKCDACGKIIGTNENRYKVTTGNVIIIGNVNRRYNKVTDDIELNLCGKCYDKIIYILQGVGENNNKKDTAS